MRGNTFSLFILTCLLLSTALCAGPPKKGYKSKLCLNDLCTEPMFKAIVVKDHPSTHAQFVSAKKGDEIEVLAIQFSDRIDLMQVKTETFSGLIYMGFLDLKPYVDFLEHSIDSGRELKIVSQERAEGEKQVLGVSPANQDLVRVYNAQAAAYARLNGLEPPVPKPIPEPEQKGHGHSHSHGHSHGHSHEAGHGHSHGPEGHEHSHEAGHGHSHGAEAAAHTREPPVTTPPPVAQQQTQPPTPTEAPRAAPPMAKAPPVQLEGNSIDEEDPNIRELVESDLRMQEQQRKAAIVQKNKNVQPITPPQQQQPNVASDAPIVEKPSLEPQTVPTLPTREAPTPSGADSPNTQKLESVQSKQEPQTVQSELTKHQEETLQQQPISQGFQQNSPNIAQSVTTPPSQASLVPTEPVASHVNEAETEKPVTKPSQSQGQPDPFVINDSVVEPHTAPTPQPTDGKSLESQPAPASNGAQELPPSMETTMTDATLSSGTTSSSPSQAAETAGGVSIPSNVTSVQEPSLPASPNNNDAPPHVETHKAPIGQEVHHENPENTQREPPNPTPDLANLLATQRPPTLPPKAAEQAATPETVVNVAQDVNAPTAQGAEPTQNVHAPESVVPQQAVPEAQPIVPTTDDPLVTVGQAEHQQASPPQEPVQPVPVLDIANEAPQPVETAVPELVGNAQPNEIPQEPVTTPTPAVPVIEAPQPPAPEAEVTLPPLSFEATTTPSPVNFPDLNLPLTEAHSIPTPSEAPQGVCDNDDCRNIEAAKPAVEGVEMPLDTIVTQTNVPESPTLPPVDTQEPVASPLAPVESPDTDVPPMDPIQHDKIIPTDVPPYPEAGQNEASTVDPFDKMNMSQIDPPIGDGLFKSMVLTMVNLARSVIPGTEGLNDAGMGIVLNLLFVCTALLMYIISYILSDGDDRIESKAAYDLSTKCIALENQLKAKESESQSGLSQRNAQDLQHMQNLQVQVQTLQHQLKQAQDRLHLSETDIQKEQSEKRDLEAQLHLERQNIATLRGTVNESERRCAELREAHDRYQAEVTKYKGTSEHMEAELSSLRRERNDLSTEAKKTEDALEDRRQEVENLREELKQVTSEKNRVEHELNEMAELVADYERLKSEAPVVVKESKDATTESVESGGGSNGWSDMDEDWPTVDEGADTSAKTAPQQAPVAEKPHTAQSTVDILESAKLRAQIKSLESQLKECKHDLEKEQTLKKTVEEKLSRLEDELKLKQRDLDDREHERKRATDRYDDLLSMFKDGNTKIKETEATCDRLRDQVAQLQTDMRTVDDEKRKKEDKLKETDGELKKLRNDYLRLETKHFNLSLEHKKMLDSQALSQPIMVSDLLPPLSLPSDREGATSRSGAGSRGAGSRAAAHLGVAYEPLWDEPPLLPSRNRTTSPESPSMGMEFYPQLKRGARSRRSERVREPSPSDSDRRKSSLKEGSQHHRRVRSRSQGRQPFAPTADLPLLGYGAPSFSVRNEGGALYLSSGGSNSGRSPPPELPARSAIPPAGLHKPKLHRPVDLNAAFK